MVYVFESPEARMDILGTDSKKWWIYKSKESNAKFKGLRRQVFYLIAYLDKNFPYYSQVNSVEISQDITNAPYSTRVLTIIPKDEEIKKNQVFIYIKMFSTLLFALIRWNFRMMNQSVPQCWLSQVLILLFKKVDSRIHSPWLHQETTQMISVIDKVASIGIVKASDPELNNDLYVRSNET